jgi:hypothetical protein
MMRSLRKVDTMRTRFPRGMRDEFAMIARLLRADRALIA